MRDKKDKKVLCAIFRITLPRLDATTFVVLMKICLFEYEKLIMRNLKYGKTNVHKFPSRMLKKEYTK